MLAIAYLNPRRHPKLYTLHAKHRQCMTQRNAKKKKFLNRIRVLSLKPREKLNAGRGLAGYSFFLGLPRLSSGDPIVQFVLSGSPGPSHEWGGRSCTGEGVKRSERLGRSDAINALGAVRVLLPSTAGNHCHCVGGR